MACVGFDKLGVSTKRFTQLAITGVSGLPMGVMRGRDAVRAYVAEWVEMFDDLQLELATLDDAGDQIVATLRLSGRAKQMGAPTELRFAIVYTIRDGNCIRAREYITREEALEAVGLRE
jgi:ketosteroid isomerase-like protein